MAIAILETSKDHAADTALITAAQVAAEITKIPAAGHFAVQVKATALTATLTFEVCVDGTNWDTIELVPSTDLLDTALTATAANPTAGVWLTKFPVSVWGFRVRCSAFTSQTAATMTARWTRAS